MWKVSIEYDIYKSRTIPYVIIAIIIFINDMIKSHDSEYLHFGEQALFLELLSLLKSYDVSGIPKHWFQNIKTNQNEH